jgi:heme exporter protein A
MSLRFSGFCARALALQRGGRTVFGELNLTLSAGELLLLTGPNGVGKSSVLRALVGLTPLASGTLQGHDPAAPITPRQLCAQALYQGHAPGIKGALTALENLALLAALDGSATQAAQLLQALERLGLRRCAELESRHLSAGQRQRLQLARFALALANPAKRLWLLDEPSAALDQDGAALLGQLLAEHVQSGGAAIVATHLPIAPTGVQPRELCLRPSASHRP